MRDPNRIDPILARLRAAWIASPDLRLGQLLVGSLPMQPIYGYPSDDAWMADRLRRLFAAECSEFGAANAPIVWPVVDRPAPTPAADPLATVLAALDAMSTHATGPWPAEIVVQVLNAAPAIAELCAEAERLRGDNLNLHPDLDAARALLATATAELAAARAVPADVEAAIVSHEAAICWLCQHDPVRAGHGANLKAAIARAIAEARQPSTVGGLLATARAKFDAVEFMSRSGDGEWTQVNGALGKQYVRVWTSGRKWIDIDGDDALLTGDDYAQPARLVLAAEADRDPNQRGPLPKGG